MNIHVVKSIPITGSADSAADSVLVFKTDLVTERDVEKIRPWLDELIGSGAWNVDLADVDRILRVKNTSKQINEIGKRMQDAGYFCEELPD
ncbi:hypothetical protein Q0590_18060 [Rhodocytophaga aerolata]|uniref:Uncharacterized protein n=1 Tax=Rhodocytophaga aerolata TaxID=455078 RepID=A0ABT8R7V7_9BACT|nr:hypothetical protein [Rhodocytophaga aerolata]MDO1448184.1 hypothetical protein [Rhodocytophaga aerolata]